MLAYLIDQHPAGWSTINGMDFAAEPGFEENGFKTAGPHCYCHGGRHEEESIVTDANAADIGCEYAYVFGTDDIGHPFMDVLSSYTPSGQKMIGMFGQGVRYSKWRFMTRVDLTGPAPDWAKIEE
jgi:hypothetical protein